MDEEMNISVFDEDYKFKIEGFEGPLDLLLTLIKDAKMDIETVRLADITDQFISYVRENKDIDLTKASYYINIACTLLEIKSKALLPREDVEGEEQEVDSEALLKLRLKEYALFKEESAKLAQLENVNHFYREPDKSANSYRIVLTDFSLSNMLDAFAKLLTKVKTEQIVVEPKKIIKDRWTVAEKMESVIELVREEKQVKFSSLFQTDYTHSEMITVFLALLELLKRQNITASQNELFGEIDINYVENSENDESVMVTEFDEIKEGA